MRTSFTTMPSPLGPLLLVKNDRGLTGVYLQPHVGAPSPEREWRADPSRFVRERVQLAEYFAGARTRFDLDLAPEGTPFQRRVWDALCAIPYGETTTYGALAASLGRSRAARAVGAANARNPLSIVIPCHRVIGAGGGLTGYAGGVARKQWLLAHEAASHVAVHAKESALTARFPLITPAAT
jgi:methylated-DNA-[protein]-cysteine S-methyltransferase